MRLDYFLYCAEAEGIESITSTRQTHIEAAIKDFIKMVKEGYDINDDTIQTTIFKNHDITDITENECKYIMRKVERAI